MWFENRWANMNSSGKGSLHIAQSPVNIYAREIECRNQIFSNELLEIYWCNTAVSTQSWSNIIHGQHADTDTFINHGLPMHPVHSEYNNIIADALHSKGKQEHFCPIIHRKLTEIVIHKLKTCIDNNNNWATSLSLKPFQLFKDLTASSSLLQSEWINVFKSNAFTFRIQKRAPSSNLVEKE